MTAKARARRKAPSRKVVELQPPPQRRTQRWFSGEFPYMSMSDLEKLGGGKVGYVKAMTAAEIRECWNGVGCPGGKHLRHLFRRRQSSVLGYDLATGAARRQCR